MSSGRSTPFSGRAPALANAFVSISGLIGAGKSTLAVALGKELNLPVHFEPVAENVYLQDFYRDMKTCVAAAAFARCLAYRGLGTRSPCRFTC
jgi:deoxyadenosine/deoxycytidine kinase